MRAGPGTGQACEQRVTDKRLASDPRRPARPIWNPPTNCHEAGPSQLTRAANSGIAGSQDTSVHDWTALSTALTAQAPDTSAPNPPPTSIFKRDALRCFSWVNLRPRTRLGCRLYVRYCASTERAKKRAKTASFAPPMATRVVPGQEETNHYLTHASPPERASSTLATGPQEGRQLRPRGYRGSDRAP